MNYLSSNDAMRARFGTKVYRLSLQSGCTWHLLLGGRLG